MSAPFTEPTLTYWQDVVETVPARFSATPPFRYGYPVRLPCGRFLVLPLRALPGGDQAVASLIANQASHEVIAALAAPMADAASGLGAEIVVGLPTLGLSFAADVARRLGHVRYAPLGYSRKFWYDEALSQPVSSITSPEPGKFLRLDPNLLPLLTSRRVVLVDDAVSSGATALAAITLLARLGVTIAGIVVAMKQGNRWAALLSSRVHGVFGCPLFARHDEGWMPLAATMPE